MSANLRLVPAVPTETAYDHVANAVQMLMLVEAALDRLNLMGRYDAEMREAVRATEARLFKALFLIGAAERGGN